MRYSCVVHVMVDAMPVGALVELVNGWGGTPRREAGEDADDYPPRSGFRDLWGVGDDLIPHTDADLAAVADQLHPVFVAGEATVAAALVNEMLEACGVWPVLSPDGDELRAVWSVSTAHDALLAAAALGLHHQLAEHPLARLGTCSGRRCADVYVDASPTGRRRFCGITCQNRARVAAYRDRHRAT